MWGSTRWRMGLVLAAAAMACGAREARASFHLWQITEVYSDPAGNVQYVEFTDLSDFEELLGGQTLTSSTHDFVFPSNLPSADTGNRHFLVGTPGYAALTGLPAPDYTLPVNRFFDPDGDALDFAGVNSFAFGAGELPQDGFQSLHRAYDATDKVAGVNSPTNFAGVTGTIPEPATAGLIAGLLPVALGRRGRSRPVCLLRR